MPLDPSERSVRTLPPGADPAFVVDVERARVLDANPAALERWGGDRLAGALLDRAMPAMSTLSTALHHWPPGCERMLDLMFWTPRGTLTGRCTCRRLAPGDGSLHVHIRISDRIAGSDARHRPVVAMRAPGEGGTTPTSAPDPDRPWFPEPAQGGSQPKTADAPLRGGRLNGAADAEGFHRHANRAIGPLQRLAHELRTPLSALITRAEIIRDQRFGPNADERYRQYASEIFDTAHHALGVLQSTIDESGSGPSRGPASTAGHDAIEPASLARRAIAIITPIAEQRSVALVLDAETDLPQIAGDHVGLLQVLINLLSNAVKATSSPGRVTLTVRREAGGDVQVVVADTGRGMERNEVQRALGADQTPPIGPAATDGRRGIGLAIVRDLVLANGAELAVDSRPGQGTRMAIRFPKDRLVVR